MSIYMVESMDEVLRTALAGALPAPLHTTDDATIEASDLATRH